MLPVVFSSITAFTAATVLLSYFTILTSSSPVHRQLQARQACVRTKLSAADISTPFALEIQNASYPDLHHRRMNFFKAGGGDNHLYLSPSATPNANHTLVSGVLHNFEPTFSSTANPNGVVIRAVINGEYTARDNTTKLFMTQRGDPRAIFDLWEGCHPETGETQQELVMREAPGQVRNGGNICVRPASGGRWEFRWSPKDNPVYPRGCIDVVLVPIYE